MAACRFELMWQHPDTRKMVLWGGTCMALPQQGFQQQPGGCLVGSEGGAVFRCSLDSTAPARQAFAQVVSTLLISAMHIQDLVVLQQSCHNLLLRNEGLHGPYGCVRPPIQQSQHGICFRCPTTCLCCSPACNSTAQFYFQIQATDAGIAATKH